MPLCKVVVEVVALSVFGFNLAAGYRVNSQKVVDLKRRVGMEQSTSDDQSSPESLDSANETEDLLVMADCGCKLRPMADVGEAGMVDFTYTWGAPGTASPALQNTRTESPCFPGHRVWHTRGPNGWTGQWRDPVPFITNLAHYAHALMDGEDINIEKLDGGGLFNCSESTSWLPEPSVLVDVASHEPSAYIETAQRRACPFFARIARMALTKSYIKDPRQAAEDIKQIGWRAVGYATHDGQDSWFGGPQVSYLFQQPTSLECTLTFQGTDEWQDWVSNVAITTERFCGLTYEDEQCSGLFGCSVRKPRGSFTHWGFTDRLRQIVKTEEFQTQIHANLPFCKKLYVVGHSAGGAMAELFGACVANALQPGDFGYEEDHKYMGFTKQEPKKLRYMYSKDILPDETDGKPNDTGDVA